MRHLALVVGEMTLRELARRRGVLVLLALLPLAFYLARRDLQGQSVRLLTLGLGWSVSTLALFGAVAARELDLRLRVAGARVADLVLGRALAVGVVGLLLGCAYAVVVVVDQDVAHMDGVLAGLAVAVVVGGPLGAALGTVLPRELEGALALLTVLATQMLTNADDRWSVALPFWSVPEIAGYAIDSNGIDDLTAGLVHASATTLLLAVVGGVAAARRLRLVRLPEPPEPASPVSRVRP